jgi:hypothetical protein
VLGALPAPAAAQGGAGGPKRPVLPRGKRSGLEARVAKLTKALGLDTKQQAGLRKLLQEQREHVQRIWSNESLPAADRIAATRALSMQTSEKIRALLTEEQRKKYAPPQRGDPGNAIGSAHVEDWMKSEGTR